MSDSTKIVVLGGGYGGVHAVKKLYKEFKKDRSVEITLIDRNPYHTLMTELHEIAGHRTEPEAVQISFKRIFGGKRVNVISDEVSSIDFEEKVVKSESFEYEYDYLVLATGGQPEFFGVPGIQENSFTLWSLEDAIRIREHVELMFREAAKEPSKEKRAKLLNFVIAGAGFTGMELAGELLELRDVLCDKYHIDKKEVRIIIVEAQDTILPILPEKPQKAAMKYLKKMGAEVHLNAAVKEGEAGKFTLSDGTVYETETFVWTCGIHGSEFTARIPLTKGKTSNDNCSIASPEGIHGMAGCHFDDEDRYVVGERGRILVTENMRSVDFTNVYLCGDMIWYVNEEKVVPQIVETAIQTGDVVAHNIIADIKGGEKKSFKPNYHGFMVSIGGKYGVAHVMGISLYGFMAMAAKHLINVHYLFELAGVNAVWGYLKEEFLTIRNKRSIIGGHASAKIPAYWALPARLWLGFVWVVEGLKKVGEGWLNFSEGTKSGWMFSQGVTQAGAAEAVAAASPEWEEGAEAAGETAGEAAAAAGDAAAEAGEAAADATAAATEWAGEATEAAAEAVNGWTINLDQTIFQWDSPIVVWFRETFMDGLFALLPYQLFQVMIVGAEVAIGLALIAGLFTWPAAVASIGLVFVFILSGMFSWAQLWFLFLAIVMMGGAGHVAGLDHWVMPWLKRRWNSTQLAQRTHLYTDEPVIRRRKK
ncbi:FAD-dependent oxidoreductase [Salinispira pacifica]|uniref:NADH:ubiquinone reductase (non-electrogenic) n=1 Tax=Salinispira pacifica TaxID=1307761 RepID=V5WMC5_9SPIO|nr:FAD-dependent oxidoreductase [Salinispira pacifica]AHC16808.1 NADH dehydrogenase [Salinispira pacifica]